MTSAYHSIDLARFALSPGEGARLQDLVASINSEFLIAEIQALRHPPLPVREAQAAYFQMRSYVLGHSEARRMMGDTDARRSAFAAFNTLLDRTVAQAA